MASSVHTQLVQESNYSAMARQAQKQAQGATPNSSIKSQDFLSLLTMQLQYQDPTNPMDNSEMLAQEAQFTTLEQMENLSNSFSKFSAAYQANSFLGQTVEVTVDGKSTTGKVDYVDFSDASGASLSIGGKNYPLSSVTKIFPQDTTEQQETNSFVKDALAYIATNLSAITSAIFGDNTVTDTITDAVTDVVEDVSGQ